MTLVDTDPRPEDSPDDGVTWPRRLGIRPIPLSVVLLLAVLAIAVPRPFLLAFILAYPAASFIRVTRRNVALALPLVVTANAGFVILLGALLRIATIPMRHEWLVVGGTLVVIARTLVGASRRGTSRAAWEPPAVDHWVLVSVYALFAMALVARVVSTFGILAPILHDPVAHAFMTQTILDGRTIDYFYAPGLHILSAFLADATGATSALTVHYTTNVASALSVLTWPMAAWAIFRDRTLTVTLALLMLVLPFPERLYYEQGKNSFVLVLALLPLVLIAVDALVRRPDRPSGLLLGGALSMILFTHHGTFIYATALAGLAVLAAAWGRRAARDAIPALLRAAGWAVLVAAVVGGLWLSLGLWDVDIGTDPVADPGVRLGYVERVGNAMSEAVTSIRHTADQYGAFYLPLAAVGLLLVVLSKRDAIRTGVLVVAATGILTPLLVPVLPLPLLSYLSRSTGKLLFFTVFAVVIAGATRAVLIGVSPRKVTAVATIVIFGIAGLSVASLHTRDAYRDFERASVDLAVVTPHDLEAFQWIRDNLGATPGFINNAVRGSGNLRHVVFPTDGGMWLPVFTSAQIAMDFAAFSSWTTHRNHDLYAALGSEGEARSALRTLNTLGYRYYYRPGRSVYGPPLDIEQLRHTEGIVVAELFAAGEAAVFMVEAG